MSDFEYTIGKWARLGTFLGTIFLLMSLIRADTSVDLNHERNAAQRYLAAIARIRARPIPPRYPAPATVPRLDQTRDQIIEAMAVLPGVHQTDAKLMRLGDWRRTCVDAGSREPDTVWVWVRAWWGDDFEPFSMRLRGFRFTWSAAVSLAMPDEEFPQFASGVEMLIPPPVWDDLPDYSAMSRP